MSSPKAADRTKFEPLAVFLCLFLIQLLYYGRALVGGPIVDDFALLHTAKDGPVFGNFAATEMPGLFWRPAVSLLLKGEWLAFHMDIWEYRVTSLLLCALTGLAIYAIVVKVTGGKLAAFASAVLFVIWPSHPETILWVAGQTDGLATCFALLALWAFVSWWSDAKPGILKAILWIVLLIAALASKESIVVVPLLILGFALATSHVRFRDRIPLITAATVVMLLFSVGYLWMRGRMIHVSMLGGGYHIAQSRTMLQTISADFFSYHLTNNLLNSYAPLSNRLAPASLHFSSDAFVTLLAIFGVGWVFRRMPGKQDAPVWVSITILLAYLLCAAWMLFGSFPFFFLLSIVADPSGLLACLVFLALISGLIFRYRRSFSRFIDKQTFNAVVRSQWFAVIVVIIAVLVVWPWLREGALPQWIFVFGSLFWASMYLTRSDAGSQEDDNRRMLLRCALAMAVASIVALLPVLTIRQVNDNLAIARLSFLATTFSVPALICAVEGSVPTKWMSQSLMAVFAVLSSIALLPVVGVWQRSERISTDFMNEVNRTSAKRMYVLCSPGIISSATTVVLGGFFLSHAGALSHNDVDVIPGYFVDGFAEGDQIAARQIGPSTWRVSAIPGNTKYRSGNLAILQCKEEKAEFSDQKVPNDARSLDITITHLSPADEVLIADERGLVVLPH